MKSSNISSMNYSSNETTTESPGTSLYFISSTTQAIMTSSYLISFVLGLLGNSFGLIIVFKRSRRNFCSTSVLIGNMALADLLVTLFAMPLAVAYLFVQNKWPFGGLAGEMACKLVHFPNFVTIAASALTILTISIERYCAVFYCFRHSFLRRSKYLTAVVWTLSIALASPYLFIYTLVEKNGQYFCVVKWGDLEQTYKSQRLYFTLVFIFLYAVPLVVMSVLYTLIGRKLWKKIVTQDGSIITRKSATKAKRKVVKLLLALVALFAFCSAPAHIMHYYMFYDLKGWVKMPLAIKLLSFWIYNSNSAINPIVYMLLSTRFRREFFRLAQGNWCERPRGLVRFSTSKSRRVKATVTTRICLQNKKKEKHV